MSWNIKGRLKEIMATERGVSPKERGGRLAVALVWPGDYRTGMSALGFLSVYGFLNQRSDVLAERFFWPDGRLAKEYERGGEPLLSLESARPLAEFDLVAASLSLENDYWYLPRILQAGNLAPLRCDRDEFDPPVLVGGIGPWSNPWPLMPFADLILTGEAEAAWPQLLSVLGDIPASLPKQGRVSLMGRKTPGSLNPGEVMEPFVPPGEGFHDSALHPIKPAFLAWPPPAGLLPPVSPIITPSAEFSDVKLVEISRGCPYGCRFCMAGFLYRPHRPWPLDSILAALGEPEFSNEKVGLVSPAPADHPQLPELLDILFSQNRLVTMSSLRLTAITPLLAEKLAAGRLWGAAVAPEAGSQRLRNIINKDLTEAEILAGARLLAEAGLKKLKLYFMIGLPNETDDDLAELAELCAKIREATRLAKTWPELQVSLANFTPKPHTPFEDAPIETEAGFKRKGKYVAQQLKGIPRLSVNLDSPLWAIVQGLLARGGAESYQLVMALLNNQGRLKPALAEIGYGPSHSIHSPWPKDKPKPWRVVVPAAGFDCLASEVLRAGQALITTACPPAGNCGRCRACLKDDFVV